MYRRHFRWEILTNNLFDFSFVHGASYKTRLSFSSVIKYRKVAYNEMLFELQRAGFLQTSGLPQTWCSKLVYFSILLLFSEIEEINNTIRIEFYTKTIFQLLFGTDRRTYVVLYRMKCGAGEGWRRSVGPIM